MDSETMIRHLRKRLLIERCIFGGIALLFVGCWLFGRFCDAKSLILVDGKPVVCVPTAHEANDILARIKSRAGGDPSQISFRQDVRVARAPSTVQPTSRSEAYRTVLRYVSPVVAKWAIIVDGKPVVALPNKKIAGDVLEAAKMKYAAMVNNLAEEPQFKESVTVDIAAVDPSAYRKTAAEALKYLFSESAPISRDAIYTVQKGDIAGTIAEKCGIKVADLEAMNPRMNVARLQIGDRLRVKMTSTKPKLTVVVRDVSERTQSTPAPIQRVSSTAMHGGKSVVLSPGRSGLSRVRVQTIYENGRRAGTEIVDEMIIRAPLPRRVAVGIR